jgi:hypothetical protein
MPAKAEYPTLEYPLLEVPGMSRRILLLCALLPLSSVGACAVEPDSAPATHDEDLIGGRLARPNEFPSTMQVRSNCTVSRVGRRHVLTAAHCVNYMISPGATIELTNAQKVGRFGSGGDDGFRRYTIERVEIEPAWRDRCQATQCGSVHVSGRNAMADAAVIVLAEDIDVAIPEAAIDLSPVRDGDRVAIVGYGCEDAVAGSWDYGGSRLRVSETFAVPFEDTIHEGSFISENDRDNGVVSTMKDIYVITPGPKWVRTATNEAPLEETADGGEGSDAGDGGDAASGGSRGPRRGGLCPGDSGGPLYRLGHGGGAIVGINANYTFKGGRTYEVDGISFSYGGSPTTNWQTRVDGTLGLKVGSWLRSIGVNTVCTGGGCE